ncbi:MAG: AAA family ATPase [Candidatus Obscuribacter sp.]|nr:AAA family ATPase [Candidatus Obscuribacter sp.]
MPNLDDTIDSLREALKVSPDNLPLRMLLGENLLSSGRFDEAESEFTTALAKNPDNAKLAVSLAQACFSNGKYSQAQVILEDCLSKSEVPARAHLLYSRVMLNEGKLNDARTHYQSAIEREPGLKDQSLEDRLGLKEGNKQESRVSDGPERRQAATAGGEIHDYDIDDSEDSEFAAMVESAGIDFDDVGGMDAVKEQIRMKIIYPLQHPETFKAYGKKTGGGILLYGPPGCGKTYLARATAGQINARFIPIGLHQVLDMWIGSSERNLHEVFEIARKTNPSVLFFDEVDALAASRSDMKQTYHRHSINQFLNELDGVSTSNEGVLILAATNAPWDIDSAFRRPGRFDRIIFIPPPDTSARASILRIILKGKPQDNVDFDFIAKKTDKFSGADLKALVEDCIEKKIEEAMSKGSAPKPITTKDLERSLKAVKPSTSEWFASARNYALYSNESGLYDEIAKYLKL